MCYELNLCLFSFTTFLSLIPTFLCMYLSLSPLFSTFCVVKAAFNHDESIPLQSIGGLGCHWRPAVNGPPLRHRWGIFHPKRGLRLLYMQIVTAHLCHRTANDDKAASGGGRWFAERVRDPSRLSDSIESDTRALARGVGGIPSVNLSASHTRTVHWMSHSLVSRPPHLFIDKRNACQEPSFPKEIHPSSSEARLADFFFFLALQCLMDNMMLGWRLSTDMHPWIAALDCFSWEFIMWAVKPC